MGASLLTALDCCLTDQLTRMNEVMMELISLPVLLAIALFIGIAMLVKILLSPESSLERRSRQDRRKSIGMPATPFHDIDNQVVTADRRHATDRRKRVFVISSEHKRA